MYDLDTLFIYNSTEWNYAQSGSTFTFTSDIWEQPRNHGWVTNSQGVLFYPGLRFGVKRVLPSIRLKEMRRGMQDYEYMWLLSQARGKALADAVAKRIIKAALQDADPGNFGDGHFGPGKWDRSPSDWLAAREEMAKAIVEASAAKWTRAGPERHGRSAAEEKTRCRGTCTTRPGGRTLRRFLSAPSSRPAGFRANCACRPTASRPPARVLAGRQGQRMVRRKRRGLGARALLARRGGAARMAPRRRAAQGRGQRGTSITSSPISTRTAGSGRSRQTSSARTIWPLFLVCKPLMQYADATGDPRVAPAVERCLAAIDRHIDTAPLFDWAAFRWFEALLPIYWLYEKSPRARGFSTSRESSTRRASTTPRSSRSGP